MPTTPPSYPPQPPRLTILGRLAIFVFIAGCLAGAYHLLSSRRSSSPVNPSQRGSTPTGWFSSPPAAEIGVAYGTEKRNWLEWSVGEFAKSKEGKTIKVNLI